MRIFLLPISARRTLIYCERSREALQPGQKLPISDRIINKTSETWAGWERAEKGWKKHITNYGNQLFRRIPFEEWGLKSLPPATKKRLEEIDNGKMEFECLYPGSFLKSDRVPSVLKALATERQALHRKRMWSSIFWMPVTIPFQIVPVIPNLPFYYMCFRAWSHYRALYGGQLLEHITSKNIIKTTASAQMDEMYTAGLLHSNQKEAAASTTPTSEEIEQVVRMVEAQTGEGKEDVMVLQKWNGTLLAEAFHLPEMEVEIERAVEQVEKAIKDQKALKEEKKEVMSATSQDTTSDADVTKKDR